MHNPTNDSTNHDCLGCLLSYAYLKVLLFSRHLSTAFRKRSEISHLHLDVGLCYCFVLHIKVFLFWREKKPNLFNFVFCFLFFLTRHKIIFTFPLEIHSNSVNESRCKV